MMKRMRQNVTIEEYEKWWLKWHRTLIAGASVGIVIDATVLYFLCTSQYADSLLTRYAISSLVGALIGLFVILFFAFSPKLRAKLIKYVARGLKKG
jgi:uncharacterized membrane protein YidH (DUF202 family)